MKICLGGWSTRELLRTWYNVYILESHFYALRLDSDLCVSKGGGSVTTQGAPIDWSITLFTEALTGSPQACAELRVTTKAHEGQMSPLWGQPAPAFWSLHAHSALHRADQGALSVHTREGHLVAREPAHATAVAHNRTAQMMPWELPAQR